MARLRQRGFTLIELLVVVAIIALLIAILIPSLGKARQLSKRASCGANLAGVGKGVYIYQADFEGTFPAAYYYKNMAFDQTAGSPTYGNQGLTNPSSGAFINLSLIHI